MQMFFHFCLILPHCLFSSQLLYFVIVLITPCHYIQAYLGCPVVPLIDLSWLSHIVMCTDSHAFLGCPMLWHTGLPWHLRFLITPCQYKILLQISLLAFSFVVFVWTNIFWLQRSTRLSAVGWERGSGWNLPGRQSPASLNAGYLKRNWNCGKFDSLEKSKHLTAIILSPLSFIHGVTVCVLLYVCVFLGGLSILQYYIYMFPRFTVFWILLTSHFLWICKFTTLSPPLHHHF